MKVATFNINNVNKRLANLVAWLRTAKPDVVCLQELKATDREFPQAALAKAGYGAVWRRQKSWNGAAILARGSDPIVTRTERTFPPAPAFMSTRLSSPSTRHVLAWRRRNFSFSGRASAPTEALFLFRCRRCARMHYFSKSFKRSSAS